MNWWMPHIEMNFDLNWIEWIAWIDECLILKLTRQYNELPLLQEDSEFVKGVLEVIVDKKKRQSNEK